jgi:hypothetical protein
LEAFNASGIRSHLLREKFESYIAPKFRVGRTIDLTHPALADLGGDLEVRQASTNHLHSFQSSIATLLCFPRLLEGGIYP